MRGTRAGASTSLEKRQPPCSGTGVLRTCLPCAWAAFQRRGNSWDQQLGHFGTARAVWRLSSCWSLHSPQAIWLAPGPRLCRNSLKGAEGRRNSGETLDQLISLVSFALQCRGPSDMRDHRHGFGKPGKSCRRLSCVVP